MKSRKGAADRNKNRQSKVHKSLSVKSSAGSTSKSFPMDDGKTNVDEVVEISYRGKDQYLPKSDLLAIIALYKKFGSWDNIMLDAKTKSQAIKTMTDYMKIAMVMSTHIDRATIMTQQGQELYDGSYSYYQEHCREHMSSMNYNKKIVNLVSKDPKSREILRSIFGEIKLT